MYYSEHKSEFEKYSDKIIHIIVDDYPITFNPWDREAHQRNSISIGIEKLQLKMNDIVIISDVDEIPSFDMVYNVKNGKLITQDMQIYSIQMKLYYYTLEWTTDIKWYHPKLLKYSTYLAIKNPESIRHAFNLNNVIQNGGWHISYYGDTNFIINKLTSFSETQDNTPQNRDQDYLENCIKFGKLFLSGKMLHHVPLANNKELPYKLRSDSIPKIGFTYWEGNELSYLHYYTIYSFCKLNPTYEVILYYDNDIDNFIHPSNVNIDSKKIVKIDEIMKIKNVKLVKINWGDFNQEIKNVTSPILKADIARIMKLHEHGGIWFDLDVLFIKPIPTNLLMDNEDITYFKYYNTIPTGFIMSTPKNECIVKIYNNCFHKLKNYVSNLNQYQDLQMFGPSLWNEVECANSESFKNCRVLDNEVVYPYMWNEPEILFFTNEDRVKPNTLCIHWYNGNSRSREYINQFENDKIDPNRCVFEKYLHEIIHNYLMSRHKE